MLTIFFYQKDLPMEGQRPKEIRVKYYEPLTVAVNKFNDLYYHPSMISTPSPAPPTSSTLSSDPSKPSISPPTTTQMVTKVYNQYGQDIPLTYKIQKTNLDLFY